MKLYTAQATQPDYQGSQRHFVIIAGQVQSLPPLLGAEAGDLIIYVPKAEAKAFEWRLKNDNVRIT